MKKVVIVLAIIFLITSIFFFLTPHKNSGKSENPSHPKAEVDIAKIIAENLGSEYETYDINDNYLNAYNTEKSLIFDTKTGEVKTIESMLGATAYNTFKEELNHQISIKYPKFISDVLITNTGNNRYTFNEDGILVEFKDYTITPAITEKLDVTLICKNIQNIFNAQCKVQDNDDYNEPKLDPNKPTIALTFDDGPNNNTKVVVNSLLENHAEATFFMLGKNMYSYESMVKLVHDSGMEVGSHTYDHQYLTKIDEQAQLKEVNDTNNAYKSITGDNIKLIRAPYGSSTKEIRENINMPFIQWSVDTEDWRLRNTEKVAEYVVNNVNDGDIVLLHDIHATTANAVGIFLPELYAKGIQVTTVSKLAELKGYSLTNGLLYRSFKK